MLYSALFIPNYKLEYQPLLAAAQPDISEDGLIWTVKLKDGVMFHDGSPMTSADVKFSYDLHLSANCRGNPDVCSSIADNVTSVEAPDASTVVFTLKQQYAPFLASGLGAIQIVPKAALEASLQRFQAAAGGVSKEEVKALVDKVSAATATADAEGNPTACDAGGRCDGTGRMPVRDVHRGSRGPARQGQGRDGEQGPVQHRRRVRDGLRSRGLRPGAPWPGVRTSTAP
ncbi:MAG: ABC transporter substrate-binding protein [Candidatus Limnocylindrales bacterium]